MCFYLNEFYCIRVQQSNMKTWADLSGYDRKKFLSARVWTKNLTVIEIIQGYPVQQ